ncbi:MAG: DUF839 domain-containing protein, partial [Acidimicrobiales bacterium]|nr:DUF839 domain-containing protein [Acidimicrobiales bacterium]
MDRREFLIAVAATSGAVVTGGVTGGLFDSRAGAAESVLGTLGPPDANGLRLLPGFTSRVLATSGEPVEGTGHVWHSDPDGGATFATTGGGWIYVSNAETGAGGGGAGAIEFASDGTVVDARTILSGTGRNCAGGATPWGTWLSCEEHTYGRVWECDPYGLDAAVARPAMGRFQHEAAAVDAVGEVVYLTEDQTDGLLYRFRPTTYPDLSTGTLEALVDRGGILGWDVVPDPNAVPVETRHQVADAVRFTGGEGAYFHDGILWFTTKGDGRVWRFDPATVTLTIAYDDSTASAAELTGVDNVTVLTSTGDVYVAEDGGNMEIAMLVADGARAVLQLTDTAGSEMTGPAFSPDGTRLYFSSQRNPGRTYEVSGPFDSLSGPPPFACSIDPDTMTLSWTDQGAYTYYLRHHINGADRYLGQTTDLEFPITDPNGTYLVRYWPTGTPVDTTCEGPGTPPFACSIDPDTMTLSWTDQG